MRALAAVLAALTLAATTGCAAQRTPDEPVTVFAAASLAPAFRDIAAHVLPGIDHTVTVRFTFDGSSGLAEQISSGAPADVFASANEKTFATLADKKLVGPPTAFATNTLTILVPDGNPAHVTGLDSSLDGADLVVCAPQVPCGAATQSLARAAGITLHPVSEETSVTNVRTKVETGQAQAGIVYATDAAVSKATQTIPIAGASRVVNTYPIAAVTGSAHARGADAFIQAVLSPAGQKVLSDYGFGTPAGTR